MLSDSNQVSVVLWTMCTLEGLQNQLIHHNSRNRYKKRETVDKMIQGQVLTGSEALCEKCLANFICEI